MTLVRTADRLTQTGPAEWFTGTVYLDEIAETVAWSRLRVHVVTFTAGARTAWHTHPLGQVLHATHGAGRVQLDGEPVLAFAPGDTVIVPPGRRHWHGAAPGHLFVHLAVQEAHPETGEEATWHEHVTDADYTADPQQCAEAEQREVAQ
jgi:quercetin dioxygenase-like cupin family protein